MHFLFLRLTIILFVAMVSLPNFAFSQNAGASSLWKDPRFQKQLIGGLGIDPGLEPNIDKLDERLRNYHDRIAGMIGEDPDKALDYLQQLVTDSKVKSNDNTAAARFFFLLGNLELKEGNVVEAAKALKTAVERFPNYRAAHQNLGFIYSREQLYDTAIKHLTETIRLGLNEGSVYGLLATAYFEKGDYLSAESAYRLAVLLQPQEKSWKLGLVGSQFQLGNYYSVISITDYLLKENPENHDMRLQQAFAFIKLGQYEKAAMVMELLDAMGGLKEKMLPTLGDLYFNAGLLQLAADTHLRAYNKAEIPRIDGALRAAEFLSRRKGASEAARLLDGIINSGKEIQPADEVRILRLQAGIAKSQGDLPTATAIWEAVASREPLDAETRMNLGIYYSDLVASSDDDSAFEKAKSFFDEVIAISGEDALSSDVADAGDELSTSDTFGLKARIRKAGLLSARKASSADERVKLKSEAIQLLKEALNIKDDPGVRSLLKNLEDGLK